MSPFALRDLYLSSLLSRATTALNSNKEAKATRLVYLLLRLLKLTTQTCLKHATLASFLYATRRIVIKAVSDKEKFTRLVGYLHMLSQSIVAPTRFFDDTLPHIRE
jgi:CRISPR/Cas system CSM-associated protein Csm2 small subunit